MSIVTSRVLGPCTKRCWQPNRRADISLSTFGMDFTASGFIVKITRAAGPSVIAVIGAWQNGCVNLFSWRKRVLFRSSETPPMPPVYSHDRLSVGAGGGQAARGAGG